jgi:hypothetical protein
MGNNENEEIAQFARGMGSPLGKFTNEVKTHLDETTHTEWLRLCSRKDVTSSELMRDVIYLLVHNRTPAEFSADDRRALLQGEGRIGALERMGVRA